MIYPYVRQYIYPDSNASRLIHLLQSFEMFHQFQHEAIWKISFAKECGGIFKRWIQK